MKRLLLATAMLGVSFAAAAQTSGTVTVSDGADTVAVESQTAQDADKNELSDRMCVRNTGSRIVSAANARADRAARAAGKPDRDKDDCVAANGSSYSREDLQGTGEVDIADALRKLDPSISR